MAKLTKSSAKGGKSGSKQAADSEGLSRYRQKRDPGKTNEPFAAERIPSSSQTITGAYVVHLHAATRRHYDLRLQVGRALKSFAVPRGPSLDPAEKRLAVNTEDHPLEYLDFEDVIPAGNYGAGSMIAWDVGRVRYLETSAEEGYRSGKIDFVLSGHKLKGRYALVHTGNRTGRAPDEANQWLLIKKKDAYSSAARDIIEEAPRSVFSGLTVEELIDKDAIAERLEAEAAELGAPKGKVDAKKLVPMLCATTGGRLDDSSRIYELKLDGVRIVAERHESDVALRYRTLRVATGTYPEIARAVRALAPGHVVLDGEIVAFDDTGRPSFGRLARRIHALRPHDVAIVAAETPVVYVVFDLLQLGERDLTSLPLVDRKRLLAKLIPASGFIRALDHIAGNGTPLYDFCRAQKLEGVVSKLAKGPYRPGPKRGNDWIKIKCEREEDFVVVGWTTGTGGRNALGSLEIATYSGNRLLLRGRVGSGLDHRAITDLKPQLAALEIHESPAEGTPTPMRNSGDRHFTKPDIVVSVQFSGWTEDGNVRHPVYRGVRPDMSPTDCTAAPVIDPLEAAESVGTREEPESAGGALPAFKPTRKLIITNRDKVFWPEEGYTKGELIDYYAAISDAMLPFLRERPIVLVRYPDGIEGKNFYQWNVPQGTPDWLRTLRFRDDDGKEGKNTFIVEDRDGLVYIANLGCIPIHILACREQSVEECDFLTIDFDIGPRPFKDAVTLALSLRGLLSDLGLVGYPKTSGQSGMHVLIPLGPGINFETAKMLVELIGRLVQVRHRDIATMERRVSERGDRLYIDTGQTGRSRTIVAPYSVRATRGATVSMPLYWDEVHLALDPRQFSMFTAIERVASKGDPMAGLLEERPDIAGVMEKLEGMLKG